MSTIPNNEKVFMVSNGTNTTYSGSASLKAMQEWYTMQDVTDTVKPYKVFTALLSQNGGDDPSIWSRGSGGLIIGITYQIASNDSGTADFTNVGAPNNDEGTYFIATGEEPNSWGTDDNGELNFNWGAPMATVLENTIGYVYCVYMAEGYYQINFDTFFDTSKTIVMNKTAQFIESPTDIYNIMVSSPLFSSFYITNYLNLVQTDGFYDSIPIEIRVYN